MQTDENWMNEAACVGMDPAIFFIDTRRTTNREETQVALSTCRSCPVSDQCLEENMEEIFGIWGGKTAEERQKMRAYAGGAKKQCENCGDRFFSVSNRARMCSDKCRDIARRKRQARFDAKRR